MATPSTDSLAGLVDPAIMAKREGAEDRIQESELKLTCRDLSELLRVDKEDQESLADEKFRNILYRIEEFKRQLDRMQVSASSSSEAVTELYHQSRQLRVLFQRIDQMESFVQAVSHSVGVMEEYVEQSEKQLEPSQLKKVLKVLPSFLKPKSSQPQPSSSPPSFEPPPVFKCDNYFEQPQTGSLDSPTSP